jgi:drug/metabolite transporter (DMT)-like permease
MTDRATASVTVDAPSVPLLFPVPAPVAPSVPVSAYVAYGAICILWGTTFVGIRVAIETVPTLLVTSIRFLIAGLILLFIAAVSGARFPRKASEWRGHIISGVAMVGMGNTLIVYAEHQLSSGFAALLAATIPIWMAVLESSFGLAKMTPRRAVGLALAFSGVGLLVAPAIGRLDMSMPFFLAVGAMQLSAICWNSGTLYSRRHPSSSDPMANAVIQMLAGGTAVTLVTLMTGTHLSIAMFSFRSVAAILYLAVFGSVIAYTAYLYALTKLSAGKVSSYAYVNPLIAVIFGAILLHEAVTLRMMAAMAVILAGVAVIQIDRKRGIGR